MIVPIDLLIAPVRFAKKLECSRITTGGESDRTIDEDLRETRFGLDQSLVWK